MNAHIRTAGVAATGANGIVLGAVLRHQTDTRADAVAVAFRSYRPDEQPVIGGRTDIVKDSQRPIEFSENHIDSAIVVQVTERCAAMHASPGKRRTSPGRDVSKLPMSQIREDNV